MSLAAQSFIASLVTTGDLKTFLSYGKIDHLFRSELDEKLFSFVDKHARTYGKLPDTQTVLTHAKVELPLAVEPSGYYVDLMRRAYVEVAVREATAKAGKLLLGDSKDPLGALNMLRAGLADIDAKQMQPFVTDYREAGGLLWDGYANTLLEGGEAKLKFGWPTLDAMAGGIEEGDVVSIVGNPAAGKTWLMVWIALASWLQGQVPLLGSMEIKPKPILQRVSAVHLKVSAASLKTGSLTSFAAAKYQQGLSTLESLPLPFWVLDGNLQAMVKDIQALSLQLKPGLILIDGAYLLKHPSEKDRFKRVAENMDLIKQELAPIAPVVCSWQFSREGRKLKKGETPGLEHIGYSDAIGQHSSLVLGLFQDDSIETEIRRKMTVLKGRNGEAGSFSINWKFENTTDFSECAEDSIEDLQF